MYSTVPLPYYSSSVLFFSESKLGSFWNIVTDSEKQIFTNEKFLASASDEGY